ncbi:MAG TPA: GGDEF domain-containing protein [Steroidobacteraceae bacterium]|nr:GGDEF domain-containing protein [Steroidobacteraceae bacterium]
MMQYQQGRQESAEILRLAVGLMGRQQARFCPRSYTLWYEHAAGINSKLSHVLDERLSAGAPITDADVARYYSEYIVARDGEAIERIQQRLLEVLTETRSAVSETGTHAAQFGQSLDQHARRLQQLDSMERLQNIVSDLLAETVQMRVMNVALARQLDSSSQEVLTLTQRLEQVQAQALKDPLTGLLNRRGFEHAIVELEAQFPQMRGVALLLADVDHFKQINDLHGHLAGDQILRAIAQVVRARTKGADISARLGGDEFAVLLPNTSVEGAVVLAEQIRTTLLQGRLRRVGRAANVENVTLSVGVAHAGTGMRLEQLLERADKALYEAKRAGRNCVNTGPAPGAAAERAE